MRRLLLTCGLLLLLCTAALIKWPVARAQQLKLKLAEPPARFLSETGEVDKKIEPSAVEPIGDGTLLLVADDDSKNLFVVEAATGKIKQSLKLNAVDKKPKWEGMARDDEGAYYVLGSHSVKDLTEPDAPEKLKARSRLFRFRLKDGGAAGQTPVIDEASVIEWDLTEALAVEGYSADPQQNKVKVEGLAVRVLLDASNRVAARELVVGLRAPDMPVRAYVADITQLPADKSRLALKPFFKFNAGQLEGVNSQLSSLEYVPAFKGFLILTSTEDASNAFHGNTLWFLPDKTIMAARPTKLPGTELRLADLKLVEPQRVSVFGKGNKAEGICMTSAGAASQTKQARFALVFDNDTQTTGIPGALQFFNLAR
jgi:hypothetical protein